MAQLNIPVIDIAEFGSSDKVDRQICQQVELGATTVGFMVIENHGVPDSVIKDCWDAGRRFFDLPLGARMTAVPSIEGQPYGYSALKSESLAASLDIETPPDLKESFSMGPSHSSLRTSNETDELFQTAGNSWPDDGAEFRAALEAYYVALNDLGSRMMRIFAVALGEAPDYFEGSFSAPVSALRILNYPATEASELHAHGYLRAGEHTDYGSLTILLQDDSTGGLQIKIDGVWCDIPAIPGTFVINIGDMLSRWTNSKWISTLHRVVVPSEQKDRPKRRQSIAFFHQPNWDAEVSCIPNCLAEGEEPKYAPVLAGPHLASKYKKSTYT